MQLIGFVQVLFKGVLLTENSLCSYRAKWYADGVSPDRGFSPEECSDEELVYALLDRFVPVRIFHPGQSPLVLEVDLKKFTKENRACTFGLRLIPKQGQVQSAIVDESTLVAINTFSHTDRGLFADIGNTKLRLEIFFEAPTSELPEMEPATDGEGPCLNDSLRRQRTTFAM